MNQGPNTEPKGKFTLIAGIFCALGGCCLGRTSSEAFGTSLVGAVIGFVIGYAGALIKPLLGFGLILISAIVFWRSYTSWLKPAPPKEEALTSKGRDAILALKPKPTPIKIRKFAQPAATPSPHIVKVEETPAGEDGR
jgi:hypothetical protein